MSKMVFKSVYQISMSLLLAIFMSVCAGSVYAADVQDTVELKNGDKITGILLTDTFTVTSPYSLVTVEKKRISEIRINTGYQNNDSILLSEGGTVEGTLEETEVMFKLVSGKTIMLDMKQCKKIILKNK